MTTIKLADRSECNESEGKDMFSCLETDGVVQCYFPTKSAHDRNSSLFCDTLNYVNKPKE